MRKLRAILAFLLVLDFTVYRPIARAPIRRFFGVAS